MKKRPFFPHYYCPDDRGWALWEILAAIAIVATFGIVGISSGTSSRDLSQSAQAVQEARLLLTEAQNLTQDVAGGSASLTSLIVQESATTSNMINTGCSSGLCGPFPGSSFSVNQIAGIPSRQIVLTGVTQAECAQIVEMSGTSGVWQSVNGLIPSAITPSAALSSCSGSSVTWLAD
ncbi:hypothetical protein [Leptospirillum ferriphilum]|uniref:hypothetical protein n=1 Tax=Leptospirillum ferriphilum TaxID=178606 RepID=UPI0006B23241|nr:hypothetical protein [Leptospirillum ferriphilum]